ncbi:hypothetical protein HN51_051673, partial [Arachis hypogaea]
VLPCTRLGCAIVEDSSGLYNCGPETCGHHVSLSRMPVYMSSFLVESCNIGKNWSNYMSNFVCMCGFMIILVEFWLGIKV